MRLPSTRKIFLLPVPAMYGTMPALSLIKPNAAMSPNTFFITPQNRFVTIRPPLNYFAVPSTKAVVTFDNLKSDVSKVQLDTIDAVKTEPEPMVDIKPNISKSIPAPAKKRNPKNPYQCDYCKEDFNIEKSYSGHLAIHACKICGVRFKPNDMPKHMDTHSPEEVAQAQKITRKYTCSLCKFHFTMKSGYLRHMETVHSDDKPYSCTICGKPFKRPERMKLHMVIHTAERAFKCDTCTETFKTKASLKHHITLKHKPLKFICDICSKPFAFLTHLTDHTNAVHRKSFVCKTCNEKFDSMHKYRKHQRVVHRGIPIVKNYVCVKCKKCFECQSRLQDHMASHEGIQKQRCVCDICGKSVGNRSTLKLHMQRHSDLRTFQCNNCGKMFKTAIDLKFHSQIHREKRYCCEVCKKKFTQSSSLTIHMRLHTGERPYKCDLCENAFVSRCLLNSHKKSKHQIA